MHAANTVEMTGELDHIVALAAEIERWPEVLPHYRQVTLLDGGGDHKTVEMAARRGRVPVKWRAVQEIDRSGATPAIRYRHIWGVTKGMEVCWTFVERPECVEVSIDHWFDPPWPLVGGLAANRVIGPHFVEAIAGLTLATIKGIVEDRDPRFAPDGRARS